MEGLFESSVKGPVEKTHPAFWFVFKEKRMLCVKQENHFLSITLKLRQE